MKKIGKFFLRLLGLLGILVLCYLVVFSFLVFNNTKLLGGIFLASGVWGILEMAGVTKISPFREKPFNQVVGTVGAFIFGIYFLLR